MLEGPEGAGREAGKAEFSVVLELCGFSLTSLGLQCYSQVGNSYKGEVGRVRCWRQHSGFRTVKHIQELCLEKSPQILAKKAFKARLVGALSSLGYGESPCPWQGWNQRSFRVPFQPQTPHDSVILLTHWS